MTPDVNSYLERIDEPRRTYGRQYTAWLTAQDGSAPPKPEGIPHQTATTMRRRIEEMLKGREFHALDSRTS